MKKDIFEKLSVPRAVFHLAIPTMLGMLFTVIYNLADGYFIGQTGDSLKIAAVTLSNSLFFFIMALANFFGLGGASVISRLLGQKKLKQAKVVSSFCFYSAFVVSLISSVFFLFFMHEILILLGATPEVYPFAKEYYQVMSIGAFSVMLQLVMGQILRSEGAAKEAMIGMIFGTVVNIILDPIMILSLNWGCYGAAFATVIGNISSMGVYAYFFLSKKTVLTISPRYFIFSKRILKKVSEMGVPPFFNTLLFSLGTMLQIKLSADYGAIQIALVGIVNRILSVPILLMIGFTNGIQPLIGYTYSAKLLKRMSKALRFTMTIGTVFGTLCFAVLFLYAKYFIGFFILDESSISLGVEYLRILVLPFPIISFVFVFTVFFQSIGKAKPAIILSILRQGLIYIPALFILKSFFGMKGLVMAMPYADMATIIISAILYFSIRRDLKVERLDIKIPRNLRV
ncbi:MAG: MATE family efflux transporter [Alphaproteobacteria bacterium]|nr:MATE family efflux transporter [Alphaproteobacteria bacterium]